MSDSIAHATPDESLQVLSFLLDQIQDLTLSRHESSNALALPTIADPQDIAHGIAALSSELPDQGWGLEKAGKYLLDQVAPTLATGQTGSRYFGFVTGGVLPAAGIADNLVTLYDPNVSVHLPTETLSTLIEDHTITLLLQLLSLPREKFTGTLTTGATSANALSLACAREEVIERTVRRTKGIDEWSLAQEGFGQDTPSVNVFVTRPHASIQKAAALVGIGRKRVIDVGFKPLFSNGDQFDPTNSRDISEGVKVLDFDLTSLEQHLSTSYKNGQGSIVVVGMGEVNTGALTNQLPSIRKLCNQYDAWLHVDAAFSAFIGLLDGYEWICKHMANCADSITSDAHKQLNVPYDAGLLFIRKKVLDVESHESLLLDVCGPGKGQPTPAYLKAPAVDLCGDDENEEMKTKSAYAASLPSPLAKNIENSKRLRALPVYAALLSEGRSGIKSIVQRNVDFRRAIETWMRGPGSKWYTVLTPSPSSPHTTDKPWSSSDWNSTILLFRPQPNTRFADDTAAFIAAVKATRKIYISPTVWHGVPAARLAVSNWRTGLEAADGSVVDRVEDSEDYRVTVEVLSKIMENSR